jgi:hypothetical protein
MASSHWSLRRYFNYYNRKYFGGRLPADTQLIWDAQGSTHAYAINGSIHMDHALRGFTKYAKMVLLHEMVHIENPRLSHGIKFRNRIRQLFEAGAFDDLL